MDAMGGVGQLPHFNIWPTVFKCNILLFVYNYHIKYTFTLKNELVLKKSNTSVLITVGEGLPF